MKIPQCLHGNLWNKCVSCGPNQCMGCQANWPTGMYGGLKIHRAPDRGVITCTADRYSSSPTGPDAPKT